MAIHPSAFIHNDAEVHPSSEIGPNVVIDGPVRIAANCRLGPSVVILGNTEIGVGCSIHSHAVIGDIPQDHKFSGSMTYCRIGNGCVIREGVTIHRASVEESATVVGDNCYLMTNCHVGHDCLLADGVTLVSGALLGGHVQVGRKAIVAGNAGVHQFVRIGELAMIGAVAMISQDVPPFSMTNHDGEVVGLNTIGLVRSGVSCDERREIKALFKIMYRSDMPMERSFELANALAVTEAGSRFVEFFRVESRRGIRRHRHVHRSAA